MNVGIVVLAVILLLSGFMLLSRYRERRNIDGLRDRFDLDRDQAERLYAAARRDGFGSAYREVVGSADRPARRPVGSRVPIGAHPPAKSPHSRS